MKILIVEDEPLAARMLRNELETLLGSEIKSLQIRENLRSSHCYIWDNDIDLLFLDLELKGRDGFDLLKESVAGSFHTIIVSAHTERAIEAYEYGVIDFIPKPVTGERLQRALERIRTGEKNGRIRKLCVPSEGALSVIPFEEISYFESASNGVMVHHRNGSVLLYRKSLKQLEKLLSENYIRIHKSFITGIEEIRRVHATAERRYFVELNDGEKLPLSRNIYHQLKETLMN